MRIRVLGSGWYGLHASAALLRAGYEVEIYEKAHHIFAGASGSNPARLHCGFHYPRSYKTRKACRDHAEAFQASYGHLCRAIPRNIYAIAADESLVDHETYKLILEREVSFRECDDLAAEGLRHVEGALYTDERHIVIAEARRYFKRLLEPHIRLGAVVSDIDSRDYDLTIDCTFCANDEAGIDRFEPCVTVLLEGPVDTSVTIMDGPFPSLYVWDEDQGLSSLTSASLTPFSKRCKTYVEARRLLDGLSVWDVASRANQMLEQMAYFYPAVRERYRIAGHKLSIRAQPKSGADARLCDVVQVGERALRVRAGKIDAVFHAEKLIMEWLGCSSSEAQEAA